MKINLNREDSILMIIDIQEKLVPVINNKEKIIKNTNILIESSRELELPIIVTEQYPRGLGGTIGELNLERDERRLNTFSKNSFTGYTEAIEKKLKDLNKKSVIIVGMETHICVFQTSRDLIEAGYDVFIVSDAVGSRTCENYLNGLDLLKAMGGIITNTETVVFDLLKIAGTNEFRKISKLIK